jgi:hypothetical protein
MNSPAIGSTDSFSNNMKIGTSPFAFSSPSSSSNSNSSFSESWATWFSEISWKTWLIVFLVLALLGFNIFYYLASGTQTISNFLAPYIAYFSTLFGQTLGSTTKQVVNTSATGTKAAADITAGTIDTTIDTAGAIIQGTTNSVSTQSAQPLSTTMPPVDALQQNTLNNALDSAYSQQQEQQQQQQFGGGYAADDSYSSIQSGNKSGWCYIGEERGIRSCAEVGPNDQCMSGDIFPTSEVCVNPNLRP